MSAAKKRSCRSVIWEAEALLGNCLKQSEGCDLEGGGKGNAPQVLQKRPLLGHSVLQQEGGRAVCGELQAL